MKRTRKTRRTFTDAQKRGLVNEVMTLVTRGHNLTEARSKIASIHKTTPISLARWSKDMQVGTATTIKSLNLTNNKPGVQLTNVDVHIPGPIKLDQVSDILTHISKLAGYTG